MRRLMPVLVAALFTLGLGACHSDSTDALYDRVEEQVSQLQDRVEDLSQASGVDLTKVKQKATEAAERLRDTLREAVDSAESQVVKDRLLKIARQLDIYDGNSFKLPDFDVPNLPKLEDVKSTIRGFFGK